MQTRARERQTSAEMCREGRCASCRHRWRECSYEGGTARVEGVRRNSRPDGDGHRSRYGRNARDDGCRAGGVIAAARRGVAWGFAG